MVHQSRAIFPRPEGVERRDIRKLGSAYHLVYHRKYACQEKSLTDQLVIICFYLQDHIARSCSRCAEMPGSGLAGNAAQREY